MQPSKREDAMKRIAIVLTSHDKLGATGKATGYYLPEAAHAWITAFAPAEAPRAVVQIREGVARGVVGRGAMSPPALRE
jgi:hypothetical protein